MRHVVWLVLVGCAPATHYEPHLPTPAPYEVQYRQLNRAWHNTQGMPAVRAEIKDAFLEAMKAEHSTDTFSLFDQNLDQGWPEADLDKVIAVFEDVPDGHFAASIKHIEAARFKLVHTNDAATNAAYGRMLHELSYVRSLIFGAPPPEVRWDVPGAIAEIDGAIDLGLRAAHNQHAFDVDPSKFAKTPYLLRLRMAHDILDRAATDLDSDASPHRHEIVARVRKLIAQIDAAHGPIVAASH